MILDNKIFRWVTLVLAVLFVLDMIYSLILGGRYSYTKLKYISSTNFQHETLIQTDKWTGRVWQIDGRFGIRELVPIKDKTDWSDTP